MTSTGGMKVQARVQLRRDAFSAAVASAVSARQSAANLAAAWKTREKVAA